MLELQIHDKQLVALNPTRYICQKLLRNFIYSLKEHPTLSTRFFRIKWISEIFLSKSKKQKFFRKSVRGFKGVICPLSTLAYRQKWCREANREARPPCKMYATLEDIFESYNQRFEQSRVGRVQLLSDKCTFFTLCTE